MLLRRRSLPALLMLVVTSTTLVACGGNGDTFSGDENLVTSLVVRTSAEMTPAWSPDVFDYNVWCQQERTPVSVEWEATGEVEAATLLEGVRTELPMQGATAQAELGVGEAMLIGPYALRCMPLDFPRVEATGRITNGGWGILGLFSSRDVATSKQQQYGEYVAIVDDAGAVVWYRRAQTPMNVTYVDGEHLAWFEDETKLGVNFDSPAVFAIHALDGSLVTPLPGVEGWSMDFHELERHDESWWVISTKVLDDAPGYDARVIIDGISEITEGRNRLVWRHDEHIDPAETERTVLPADEPIIEPVHANAIQVLEDGSMLVTARELQEVFLIDGATKRVRWRLRGLGAPLIAGNIDGAKVLAIEDSARFRSPHDARFLSDGTISVFDNRTGTGERARLAVYAIDEKTGAARLVWERRSETTSSALGMVREWGAGFVVSWGSSNAPLLEEIAPDGKAVFSLRGPGGVATYRAPVVNADAFDRAVLRNAVQ